MRATENRLVGFSEPLDVEKRELKDYLYKNLYNHPRVSEISNRGADMLGELFMLFRREPERLPVHVRARFGEDGEARAIADYTAGMTDRFAMVEHERLGGVDVLH